MPLDGGAARSCRTIPIVLRGAPSTSTTTSTPTMVRRVLADEIGAGSGANFVIKRTFLADITAGLRRHRADLLPPAAGARAGRVLDLPRAHRRPRPSSAPRPSGTSACDGGTVVMNPISGTLPLSAGRAPTSPASSTSSPTRKEADELYMVLDEELKMMARICDAGGRASWGRTSRRWPASRTPSTSSKGAPPRDVRDILRETLFAPTVTGSPLESACRVIAAYEPDGRGYYGGVLALHRPRRRWRRATGLGDPHPHRRHRTLPGRLRLSVGATLVRDSDPAARGATRPGRRRRAARRARRRRAGGPRAAPAKRPPTSAAMPRFAGCSPSATRPSRRSGFATRQQEDPGPAAARPQAAGRSTRRTASPRWPGRSSARSTAMS